MAPVTRVFAALAGLWLALVSMAAPAHATERISMRLEVFGPLGVPVLTLHNYLDVGAGRYAIVADYATRGVVGLVLNLRSHAEVQGHIDGAVARPDRFLRDTRRNGVDQHNRVEYRPDGAVDGNATPAPPTPQASAAARGTVDNLTAYLRLERQLARTGSCALTVAVFDGRHRYDLVFSDVGQQALTPSGGQRFEGRAIGCRMVRRYPVAVADEEQEEGARSGTIWYARLIPGDQVVPVRMSLDTQIGTVDGYLAQITGRGVDLRLME